MSVDKLYGEGIHVKHETELNGRNLMKIIKKQNPEVIIIRQVAPKSSLAISTECWTMVYAISLYHSQQAFVVNSI